MHSTSLLSPDHAWAPEKHQGGNIHFGPEGIVAQESLQIENQQLQGTERQIKFYTGPASRAFTVTGNYTETLAKARLSRPL